MSVPEHQVDVREWLSRALEDVRWARYSYEGRFPRQACFGCQQAVEKALKALLLACDQPLERTHSLPKLRQLCEPFVPELSAFDDSLTVLDAYYAPTRYADVGQEVDYTEERVENALARTDEIVQFLRREIEARLEDR